MPNSDGAFVGLGYSKKSSDAWTRVFGPKPAADLEAQRRDWLHNHAGEDFPAALQPVPTQPSREVEFTHGFSWDDAEEGLDPEEEADHQAARDGYNPEW